MSTFDYMDLCRLCLVKDQVSVPIFEGDGDARQIFHKIAFCLPVKVNREDKLPKKICDDCAYKVELCYQFYNTTANAEKQLMQWLGEVGLEDKQGYEQEVMTSNIMKQEQADNRINVTVISNEEQSNSMEINMIDGMSLSLPIIMNQQMPAVSMSSTDNLQSIQSVAGTSVQATGNRMRKDGEEIDTEEDDNSDDECDADDGLQVVKEESENTSGSRSMESTTYVNVLPCNEAGPSGLQKQKLSDIMEMGMQQSEDNTKTGSPKTQYSKSASAQFQNASETSTPTNLLTYYFCKTCNISYEGLPGDPTTDSFIRTHSKKYIKNSKPKCHPEEMIKILKCQLHKCRHCSFSSLDFQRIVLHEKYKHNELTKQYKCRKCYKNQMTYVEYRSHFCEPEDVKRREILKKEAEENGEFSLCEFCGFATKKKKTLRYHIKSYHTERKFHCTLCKKKFVTELGLKKHLENHVDSESRVEFLCDYCRRSFKMKENLRNHIMGVHMHMKDSVCSICSKSFAKRNSLRQHLLLHSGKRPYICDICGKTFVQKPALTSHRKTHPGKLPPMPAVFIDSYIKEVDPTMVYQHVLPVPKLKTQSQKFEDFQ